MAVLTGMQTKNSEKYFKQAQEIMVGGVNSPVRTFKAVGGNPLLMDYGKGSQLFDVDGNAFTDYCLSWGALIYGHAHRNVVIAAKKAANQGMSFGTTTAAEVEIAKRITEQMPSIDKIRFVNSGTEATMSAIRLARGFTKRRILVKFDGCYHGHFDDLLIKAGSGVAQLKESSSLGIIQSHIENTISLPYNDITALEQTLSAHRDDIACVIIEPIAGNMGVIPAQLEFLRALRDLTKKYNIVLIFDEIITGFRINKRGAQAEFNIIPDLTCLGKIIGGGFPVGAYGGRKEIMECLSPLGGVYQAGTFSGNPVVMNAGLATIKLLNQSFYDSIHNKSDYLAKELNQYFAEKNIPAHVSYYGAMFSLRFRRESVLNYGDAQQASHHDLYAKLFQHLLSAGIYFPCADLESFFISGMHTKKDLDKLIRECKNFFQTEEGA